MDQPHPDYPFTADLDRLRKTAKQLKTAYDQTVEVGRKLARIADQGPPFKSSPRMTVATSDLKALNESLKRLAQSLHPK